MSAQTATVAAVARRGYLNDWNDDELLARQVVKLAEELGELANMLVASDLLLDSFFGALVETGMDARELFNNASHFVGAECIETQAAIAELTDCQVVVAVAAHALQIPDIMYAAQVKAERDAERGVRNGN